MAKFLEEMKNTSRYILLFVCVAAVSSCNRGVGCPSDFSWNTDGLSTLLRVLESIPVL